MFTSKRNFAIAFSNRVEDRLGKSVEEASINDKYVTLAGMVKEELNRKWARTNSQYLGNADRQVYYFSLEFLTGKLLDLYLIYLGIREICIDGLKELGINYSELEEQEAEAGLGNGGLGRLAACFLDSMATLELPGHGCGIRYRYGLFRQKIVEGYQVEIPDNWLREENVWEIRKPDKAVIVRFGGNVHTEVTEEQTVFIHENFEPVLAVPYDMPVQGYNTDNVNTLRLWSAEPAHSGFDIASFNAGDYSKALEYNNSVQAISEILYPDDSNMNNRTLRLKQEYFLVSAGLQSIFRRFKKGGHDLHIFHEKVAIHINDTHPALAVPEMMRILMDEEGMNWDEAWKITTKTISYTNHTILPEALEKWQIYVFKPLLPRIYMIVEEINERHCKTLWKMHPGDWKWISDTAIIADGYIRMAYLAVVGSYSVNGVSKLHSNIVKDELFKDFYNMTPWKFNNKTNGITFRRWVLKANPLLTKLISDAIGSSWLYDPINLELLAREGYDTDQSFTEQFIAARLTSKKMLASYINKKYNIPVDPNSLFDIHVKRIHAFKRQLLNALHIMHMYNMLKDNPNMEFTPRTCIFAGKAAPGYYYAKKIIKLIHMLAEVINNDAQINGKLKVVFLENYNVTLAELIFPAADISQQISTAGKEASGTGNMKSIANGAVILGTRDGANIEIENAVGSSNIITFGLSSDEVRQYYSNNNYSAYSCYENNPALRRVIDQLTDGFFCMGIPDEFLDIRRSLIDYNDEYFVLADFPDYNAAYDRMLELYRDARTWNSMAVRNVAFSGRFGSDGTIAKYADEIWNIEKSPVKRKYLFDERKGSR